MSVTLFASADDLHVQTCYDSAPNTLRAKQSSVWAATDWLMAEAQPDPAYLDRMLGPVAPNTKLSVVMPGKI